jgi:sigma-B regulation protein RsbQ
MRILLIGSDPLALSSHKEALEAHEFIVDIAHDDIAGEWSATAALYGAILLDVLSVGWDRFSVLRTIRRTSKTPVLVVTPRDTVEARMQGIDAGANDFLVRPFSSAELVSRVRTLLMLQRTSPAKHISLRLANLEVDLATRSCFRSGKQVDLTPTEFALFAALLRRRDQVVPRISLLREVWKAEAHEEANVVEVTVRRLRIKLDNSFEVRLLHTVRGVGYVLQDRSRPGDSATTTSAQAPVNGTMTQANMVAIPAPRIAQKSIFSSPEQGIPAVGGNVDLWKRNNVWISGEGPATLIFAHGFGCDQSMWRLTAPLFRSRFRTILFDHVGSGGSDLSAYNPVKYGSLRGYGSDVNEVLDKFAQGPTIFIGHSVSAMIGALADLEKPGRIVAHVMVSPSPCYVNDGAYVGGFERSDIEQLLVTLEENYLGWSRKMAPVIMGAPDQPALGEELTDSFCRTDPDIAKHFARVTFLSDHRADLARLSTPTLLLQCDDDVIAPLAVGEYMHRLLPKSTLRVINNIGHCPHLSAASACVASIEKFLHQVIDHAH